MARPREFEPEEALAAIKDAFWRRGYEATSMHDIEGATGQKKQSLYRVFGDKRSMYLKALEHYGAHEAAEAASLLSQGGTARARFQRLFDYVIETALAGDRRGCFLCNASIDQAPSDKQTRKTVARLMATVRDAFENALQTSAPYDKKPAPRARKAAELMSVYFGLRVLVRAGMKEAFLRNAAKEALAGI